jgi:hypothetical protein
MDYKTANAYCGALTDGGYYDWYLPSIQQLRGLIICSNGTQVKYGPDNTNGAQSCEDGNTSTYVKPTIDSPPFIIPKPFWGAYWSSTLEYYPDGKDFDVWVVSFYNGSPGDAGKGNNEGFRALCVRGGP